MRYFRFTSLALVGVVMVGSALLTACSSLNPGSSTDSFTLTGCGSASHGGSGTGSGTSGTPSAESGTAIPSGTVVIHPIGTPGKIPFGTPGATLPPNVTPDAAGATGLVTVTVSADTSRPCALRVAVANGLDSPVMTADHQTGCSIVTVQMQVQDGWQPLPPCQLMTPTRMIQIPAHAVMVVSVVLNGGRMQATLIAPGTYRAAFTYGAIGSPSARGTVFSAPFQVQ